MYTGIDKWGTVAHLVEWSMKPPSRSRSLANNTALTKGTAVSSSRPTSTENLYFFFFIMKAISPSPGHFTLNACSDHLRGSHLAGFSSSTLSRAFFFFQTILADVVVFFLFFFFKKKTNAQFFRPPRGLISQRPKSFEKPSFELSSYILFFLYYFSFLNRSDFFASGSPGALIMIFALRWCIYSCVYTFTYISIFVVVVVVPFFSNAASPSCCPARFFYRPEIIPRISRDLNDDDVNVGKTATVFSTIMRHLLDIASESPRFWFLFLLLIFSSIFFDFFFRSNKFSQQRRACNFSLSVVPPVWLRPRPLDCRCIMNPPGVSNLWLDKNNETSVNNGKYRNFVNLSISIAVLFF